MKKTIYSLLVLLLLAFTACDQQSSEDTVPLQSPSSTIDEGPLIPFTDNVYITVQYGPGDNPRSVQALFRPELNIISVESCLAYPNTERWTVPFISEQDFFAVVDRLNNLNDSEFTASNTRSNDPYEHRPGGTYLYYGDICTRNP